tara:strand:+ start:811 stop:2847 length:2037 start_codon:yes stop_codon:yes gene_type:complete
MATIQEYRQRFPTLKDRDLFDMALMENPNLNRSEFLGEMPPNVPANQGMVFDQSNPIVRNLSRLALLGQGATFGSLDDIAGGIRGLMPGTTFEQERQNVRDALNQARQAEPLLSLGLEVAGGLLSGMGGSKAIVNTPIGQSLMNNLRGRSRITRGGANLAGGGVAGGVTAIPYSESGNLSGDIAQGATLGLLGNAIFQPVAAVGERLVQNVTPFFGALKSSFADTPEEQFTRKLRMDASRDDITADDVIEAGRSDPQMMMADFAGTNIQALADAFASLPSSAKTRAANLLDERAKDAQNRLLKTVADSVGISERKVNFDQVNQTLLENMRKIAPRYEQILDENIVQMTPELKDLLETPTMKNATKRAISILQDERKPTVVQQFNPSFDAQTGEVMEFTISETPSLHTFQKIKEGLDELIDAQTDITGKVSSEGARFVGLKNDLLKELDKIDAYKAIRNQYSTEKSAQRALELGRKFTREDSEVTERMFENLSDNDKAFFRLGAARNLSDKIEKKAEGAMPQALTSLDAQKIRSVFDPDNADKIINRFATERMFQGTKNTIAGGAPTQLRQAKVGEMNESPLANVNIANALPLLARGLFGNPAGMISEAERDIAGRVLFSPIVEQEGVIRNLLNQPAPITRENVSDRLRFDLTAPGLGGDIFRGFQFGAMPTLINRPNE